MVPLDEEFLGYFEVEAIADQLADGGSSRAQVSLLAALCARFNSLVVGARCGWSQLGRKALGITCGTKYNRAGACYAQ